MELFATCPTGFEHLLAQELLGLGLGRVRPLKGQVAFEGSQADALRACLWSRLASRVVVVLARGDAHDADALYQTVAQVPWEDHLRHGASIAIDAHGTNSQLRNTQFVALRTKDAVVDHMTARTGTRPAAQGSHADLRLVVRVSRERATVGIDLAGEPLFRRGYEAARGSRQTVAPLRPDYAAALLMTGGWGRLKPGEQRALVVPFVGAGTLAVEAAAMAAGHAPGLLRHRWGFEGWAGFDQLVWDDVRTQAQERPREAPEPVLLLSDLRTGCDAAARKVLRAAGIDLTPTYVGAARLPERLDAAPLVVADLSWVEDAPLPEQAQVLARLAALVASQPDAERAVVLASDLPTDALFGDPAARQRLQMGSSELSLSTYERPGACEQPLVSLPDGSQVPVLLPTSAQFAARLRKVARLRRSWARREDVSCYRVYDSDLPDYAVSVDLYEGSETPGRWLQMYEYAPPKGIDETRARARLLDAVLLAPRILEVRPQDTFVRVRTKARGGSQYAAEAQGARPGRASSRQGRETQLAPGAHLVDEGGLTFEVNFQTRLDCGIFLDHRETRAMLRELAKQTKGSKRFLNLFAYTGTGSCYAADGGARYTTTVDLSRPSLDWARRNMERNGFTGPEHEYVQADVIAWVGEQRRTRNRWDLVFCDVPTFSNSQRMRSSSFDVQRDHAELLIGVSRLLTRDGVCVFSCNLRTFRIDEEALAKAGVVAEDITAQTIPEDFARNPRIHRCYLVRRVPLGGQPT